jgi:hypothetical protein
VQLGLAENAYQRFHAMGRAAYDSMMFLPYARAMYFTGRWNELVGAAREARGVPERPVYTLAALAAAAMGDAPLSAELATRAANAHRSELRWLIDITGDQLHGNSALITAAVGLSKNLDDAARRIDEEAKLQALLQYAKQIRNL